MANNEPRILKFTVYIKTTANEDEGIEKNLARLVDSNFPDFTLLRADNTIVDFDPLAHSGQ